MVNETDLLWLPYFIVLGIYFIFGTKFSWNDTCFNIEYALLGRNFDFLGVYLVVTAPNLWLLLVTVHYLVVIGEYCSLPLVTAHSHF